MLSRLFVLKGIWGRVVAFPGGIGLRVAILLGPGDTSVMLATAVNDRSIEINKTNTVI